MGNPKIGRRAPTALTVTPGDPAPDESPLVEEATVHDFRQLVKPVGSAPTPPRCILKKLKSRDLVWRWLSEPHVKRLGKRMYETYSADATERALINSGKDAPPGVRVDADNRVRWLDDAYLGTIPRRYFLQRQAMRAELNTLQTKASRNFEGFKEAARRVGAEVTQADARSWEADELEEREPK